MAATRTPMKKWKPAADKWVQAFERALPRFLDAEPRKMFGYSCAFCKGNMVAGLHEAGLILRLPEEDRQTLIAQGGQPFEPMPGRPMREYVVAPDPLADDEKALHSWLEKSFAYVRSLPTKVKKAPAKKPAAKKRAK